MTPWVSFNIKQWHGEGVRQTGSFFPVEMICFSMFYAGFLAFRRSFFLLNNKLLSFVFLLVVSVGSIGDFHTSKGR